MEMVTDNMDMTEMGEEDPGTTTEDGKDGDEKKASPGRREGLLEWAKKELEKVKEILLGKTMLKNREDGSIRIGKDVTRRKAEEEEFNADDLIDEGEEVSLEIEKARDGKKATDDRKSGQGSGSGQTTGGYSFLGELEEEEKDEELEKRDKENRKRKREDVKVVVKVKGLASSIGWKDRAEAGRGEEWWKRTVEKVVGGEKSKVIEKIPLLDSYDLGVDRRGLDLNS